MSDTSNFQNPMGSFAQSIITMFARHGMSWLSGLLVGAGVLTGDQQTQFVTGGSAIILWLAPIAWGWYQKKVAHKAVDVALNTPVPTK